MSSNKNLSDIENQIKKLENKISSLEKKNKENDKILKSYDDLLNTLLIYHKVIPSELIKNAHDLNIEMLKFVDNVCNKYNLDWWLYGGSLLGAIRHQGFIPWDDDIDIAMMRKDYDNFIDKIKIELEDNGLTDNIKVKTNTIVRKHLMAFTKLDYYHENAILGFIDVFPNDYINYNNSNTESKFKKVQKNALNRLTKREDIDIVIEDVFNQLDLKRHTGDYIINGIENRTYFHVFDKNHIFPLKQIQFEDNLFPIPNNYPLILENIYGEYMKLPKTVYNHSFFNKLANTKNVYKLLQFNVKKLHKINENFD